MADIQYAEEFAFYQQLKYYYHINRGKIRFVLPVCRSRNLLGLDLFRQFVRIHTRRTASKSVHG